MHYLLWEKNHIFWEPRKKSKGFTSEVTNALQAVWEQTAPPPLDSLLDTVQLLVDIVKNNFT